MKNKLLKFFRNFAVFLIIAGILFSNIPFNALTFLIDSHKKANNIVDQAWHLSQNSNAIDNFVSSYRNKNIALLDKLAGNLKINEAHAAASYVGGVTCARAGSTATALTCSLTALTGGSNTSPSQNDIVIAVVSTGSTADRAIGVTNVGYTELPELYANGTTYDTNLSVSWKIMGATPDTAVNFSASGSTADAISAVVHVWRGIDTGTPFDVTNQSITGTATGQPNPPPITPVTSGATVIAIGAGAAATGVVYTAAGLANFRTVASVDTQDSMTGMGSFAWSSGAYDSAQWTGGTANAVDSWASYTLALRPSIATVATSGTQTANMTAGTANNSVGGLFSISTTGDTNITGITITESGTVDALNNLNNIKLYSENDTTAPYDCASESLSSPSSPTEAQFGATDTNGFSAANGISVFTGSVAITSTATMCVYVVLDAGSGASAGDTIEISINASGDITSSVAYIGGTFPVAIAGSTTIIVPSYTLTVGATGTQTSAVDSGTTTAAYLGGAFTFVLDSGSATLDSFVVSEMGSTTANTSLTNVDIQTDTDGAYPGSTVTGCTGLTFNASQKLTCTPSGGLSLSSATTRYIYVVANTISSGAAGGETIEIEITNAATEVSVTGATNGSSGTKAIGGTTTIRPNVTDVTDSSLGDGGRNGETFTITGAGFGTACGSILMQVEGTSLTCNSANNTTISATIPSGQTTTYGGTGANGLLVTVGGAADDARQTYYIYPDITSTTPSSATGAKEGDSVTISGTRFGSAGGTLVFQNCAGGDVDATPTGVNWTDTSLTVTVPDIADDDDSCNIKITRATGTGSKDDSLIGFTILPKITVITNCDSSGFPSGARGREYDAGDTPCPNTLTDGAIIITGNHFGASGSITILGQTASQFAVAAFCTGSAYTADCIAVRVPDTIGNGAGGAGDYVGDIVLTRSDSKTDTWNGFRVLPRITGFTPGSAAISESVTVNGNHFCQNGGVCPSAFDATNNYVIFNSNATATSFVSWNNTAMATVVPTGASTGNVFLRSNGYNSNAESFTVNVPTPTDPSNMKQSRNSAFTNLIATGGVASSTPVYLSATTSSGVGGGTMYLQVEVRPTLGANKDFSSPSICTSAACTGLNPYCFENAGASYPTGGVSLTATSSITLTDEYYHWQTRARYNKSSTDYCSAWQCYPDSGCNSEVATDLEIDTVAPVISSASSTPSTNGATISWDTIGDLSTTQLEYGTDSGLSGSTFTAITDTPPETNGKTAGHSVALSNLNSNTTYYYRARSKDSGNLEGISSILNFITNNVTEGPSKTTSFHIVGATGLIAGGSTATTTFAVSMPETASTTKSAFVEITGVYYASGASSKDIAVQVNSQTARTYVVPASTTSFFKFIYQVSPVNPSNALYVTPQANTTVYITSAKLIVNYAYTP